MSIVGRLIRRQRVPVGATESVGVQRIQQHPITPLLVEQILDGKEHHGGPNRSTSRRASSALGSLARARVCLASPRRAHEPGILRGQVITAAPPATTKEPPLFHQLFIAAPALNNYRYLVISVETPILMYPLKIIIDSLAYVLKDEEAFVYQLEARLSSDAVHGAIRALLVQSGPVDPLE